ncbi:hypothetical protein MP228_010841 [Amoeboaphelidium protococcarum]|nr:hypothetical protein MP228_010841 [Amoeboaphelidium protococcarum]
MPSQSPIQMTDTRPISIVNSSSSQRIKPFYGDKGPGSMDSSIQYLNDTLFAINRPPLHSSGYNMMTSGSRSVTPEGIRGSEGGIALAIRQRFNQHLSNQRHSADDGGSRHLDHDSQWHENSKARSSDNSSNYGLGITSDISQSDNNNDDGSQQQQQLKLQSISEQSPFTLDPSDRHGRPKLIQPLSLPNSQIYQSPNQPLDEQLRRCSMPAAQQAFRVPVRRISSNGSRNWLGAISQGSCSAPTSNLQQSPSTHFPCIDETAYSSLPPSPAISFLGHLAGVTSAPSTLSRDYLNNSGSMNNSGTDSRSIQWENVSIGDLSISKKIGSGNFSQVYDGVWRSYNVAVKIVQRKRMSDLNKKPCSQSTAQQSPSSDQSSPSQSRSAAGKENQITSTTGVFSASPNTSPVANNTDSDEQKVQMSEVVTEMEEDDLFYRELSLWKSLSHPNIVPLLDIIEFDEQNLLLVMEICKQGQLLTYINEHPNGLTEDIAKYIFRDIVSAVSYLHSKQIVHRDIKPENVFLDFDASGKLVARLGDFSLSERFQLIDPLTTDSNGNATHVGTPKNRYGCECKDIDQILEAGGVGSLEYASPEELDHSFLHPQEGRSNLQSLYTYPSPTSDVWSLGVTLYVMLCNQLPFCDVYGPRCQLKILSGCYKRLRSSTSEYSLTSPNQQSCGSQSFGSSSLSSSFNNNPSLNTRGFLENGRTYSKDVVDLLDGMLSVNVYKRLSMEDVAQCQWLATYNKFAQE